MKKFSEIITHPGSSHKDEFLACSLLVAVHEAPILRRDPTQQDISNPRIAVVDVGGFHQPELGNFDHHQFPKDHPPTCSLSLVLMDMGLYEDARQYCDWLEVAEWFDTRGPQETAAWLGVERELLAKVRSRVAAKYGKSAKAMRVSAFCFCRALQIFPKMLQRVWRGMQLDYQRTSK